MKRVLAMSSVDGPEEPKKQLEEPEKEDAVAMANKARADSEAKAQEKQKEDIQRHEKEARLLYEFYGYDEKSIDKHAHIITIGRYKREQNKKKFEKLKLDLENKQNNKRAEIEKGKLSEKKIKQKNIEIAELEIRILYCNSKIEDAQTHYELFDKINTKATLTPTPKTLDILKNQTVRINNAIQTQRKLLTTLKKNALASAKAARSLSEENLKLAKDLLTKSPREAMEGIQNIRGKKAIKENKAVLAYIQCERNKRDSEIDYQFSRKIFENAVRDASKEADATKELKEQLASLTTAINEREGYKKELVAAENRLLDNFNAEVSFAEKIAKMNENSRKLGAKNKDKEIAALEKQLEDRQLEDKQLIRQIDDANRLYSFSNYLIIAEAAKEGDTKKLAKKLTNLKVAANRQKIYRKKLEAVEKKILNANTNKPKTENNKERNELTKTQLEREKEDAELAHSMMTELIEEAEKTERADNDNTNTDPNKKTNLEILKGRASQLREGIGGRRKYRKYIVFGQTKNRLALEDAENKHLEIKIKRKENTQRLDDPKFDQTKEDLKSFQKARGDNKAELESVILNRMSLHDIREIGQLSIKDATLRLKEKQASRRVSNAAQDHAIGRAFLAQARAAKDPSHLQSQFALMEITVADRNVLTRQLEEEEARQLKKKNEIQKAEFEVIEHKKKLEIEKETLKDMARTKNASSPEFIAQQSAVYASESQLQYKEWELKKLQRRQAEEATFDDRRLANAIKNEQEANRLLNIILNPKTDSKEREKAQKDLKELKKQIKKEKDLEKKLAPPARVKEREEYRQNLEKAEEKRLEHTKKMNALAIEELQASFLVRPITQKQHELAEKRKRLREKLEIEDEQIKREEADAKLLYDFSAKLIQLSINDTNEDKARDAEKKLKAQFKELKAAAKIQKKRRDRIKAIDKRMNSSLYLSLNIKTKAQLQRQKDDLIFGHTETQKLIQAAFDKDPPDPKGLAKDCKNLSAGIGGYSVFKGGLFGQERNREALDKYESLDSKNEKNLLESNIRLTAADAVKNEHPKRYKRALENYEDCTLLKEQSRRRLLNANNDYEMGKALLKAAVADEPKVPSKSVRLARLQKQFAVLNIGITARNKLVRRLETIEKNAKETERKDAKNIKQAEDGKASLEKELAKAKEALKRIDPKKLDAIDKQNAKIEQLQEKLDNQTDKIRFLKDKESENKTRNDSLIKSAKQSCNDANTRIKTVLGSTNEKAVKNSFTSIQDEANSADNADKRERKAQNKSYNAKIEQAKTDNKSKRQTKAVARKKELATAKQAVAAANQVKTTPGTDKTSAASTTAPKTPASPAPIRTPAPPPPGLPPRPTMPRNIFSIPVHNTTKTLAPNTEKQQPNEDIALQQAANEVQNLTTYRLTPNKATGGFTLFDRNDNKLGELKFDTDQNEQRIMTATFQEPVKTLAISAVQIFAAYAQPNNIGMYPPKPPAFSADFGEPIQKFAIDNVPKIYETVHKEKTSMTMAEQAESRNNTAIVNRKITKLEPPPLSPQLKDQPKGQKLSA